MRLSPSSPVLSLSPLRRSLPIACYHISWSIIPLSRSELIPPSTALPSSAVPLTHTSLQIHVYQPPLSSAVTEFATPASGSDDGKGEDSDVMAASVLSLPSRSLEGVWDSLVYEDDVKGKLLGYIYSTMLFSDACVDFNIVTWNR